MIIPPGIHLDPSGILFPLGAGSREGSYRGKDKHGPSRGPQRALACRGVLGLLAAMILLSPLVFAQGSPRVTGVAPSSGKVNDNVTVTGENLGKGAVSAVLLSDDKVDYKATVVDQAAEKIVMKVPQVKPGDYNVSIQVGNNIFIQPVRFKVQE